MMQVIQGARGSGKTTELIKLASYDNGYIVCHDHQEAFRIAQQATAMGEVIHFPITFREFFKGEFYTKGVKQFYIDNVDKFLQQIAGSVPIHTIVLNKDAPPVKPFVSVYRPATATRANGDVAYCVQIKRQGRDWEYYYGSIYETKEEMEVRLAELRSTEFVIEPIQE